MIRAVLLVLLIATGCVGTGGSDGRPPSPDQASGSAPVHSFLYIDVVQAPVTKPNGKAWDWGAGWQGSLAAKTLANQAVPLVIAAVNPTVLSAIVIKKVGAEAAHRLTKELGRRSAPDLAVVVHLLGVGRRTARILTHPPGRK